VPAPESPELLDLAVALDRLWSWIRRHSPPTELSMTARTTLSRLADDGPARISDLARREGVTQPAMSGLINRLDGLGLARREADPADGRAALAVITDQGRDFMAERRRLRAEVLAHQVGALAEDDRRALLAALPALERLTGVPVVA
jgi:DNA-binding MarR family transcriptional regulator